MPRPAILGWLGTDCDWVKKRARLMRGAWILGASPKIKFDGKGVAPPSIFLLVLKFSLIFLLVLKS